MRADGGAANTPGWLIRSVPNRFPVLSQSSDGQGLTDPLESGRGDPQLFSSSPATGTHEVIVHSPEHVVALADLGATQLGHTVDGWRERMAAHADAAYVHTMVNEGAPAGASLEHSHAQLYALDFVPAAIARERERFTAHNTRTMGGCLMCDLLAEEVKRRERIVAIDDDAVLLVPFASRVPYELRIAPRQHESSFAEGGAAAAGLLAEAVRRLRARFGSSPPINVWVRTAPRAVEHFHWHIDISPRLTHLAGFELGTGVNINIVPPEQAAKELEAL